MQFKLIFVYILVTTCSILTYFTFLHHFENNYNYSTNVNDENHYRFLTSSRSNDRADNTGLNGMDGHELLKDPHCVTYISGQTVTYPQCSQFKSIPFHERNGCPDLNIEQLGYSICRIFQYHGYMIRQLCKTLLSDCDSPTYVKKDREYIDIVIE